jgi:hypothetical protein
MTTLETLIEEAEDAPEAILQEVIHYLRYLKAEEVVAERHAARDMARLSESALAKDWLKPEEDEAWQYLAVETL